jgi:hypothetical protein
MIVEPVITFRNLSPVDWIEADIQDHVRRLQSFCTRITSCRVLVEVPHRHHRHGNGFHLRIELSMPGHEIAVSLAPDLHARQRDLKEAVPEKRLEIGAARKDGRLVIRKAFDRATRQLAQYTQRRQVVVRKARRGRASVAAADIRQSP